MDHGDCLNYQMPNTTTPSSLQSSEQIASAGKCFIHRMCRTAPKSAGSQSRMDRTLRCNRAFGSLLLKFSVSTSHPVTSVAVHEGHRAHVVDVPGEGLTNVASVDVYGPAVLMAEEVAAGREDLGRSLDRRNRVVPPRDPFGPLQGQPEDRRLTGIDQFDAPLLFALKLLLDRPEGDPPAWRRSAVVIALWSRSASKRRIRWDSSAVCRECRVALATKNSAVAVASAPMISAMSAQIPMSNPPVSAVMCPAFVARHLWLVIQGGRI